MIADPFHLGNRNFRYQSVKGLKLLESPTARFHDFVRNTCGIGISRCLDNDADFTRAGVFSSFEVIDPLSQGFVDVLRTCQSRPTGEKKNGQHYQ